MKVRFSAIVFVVLVVIAFGLGVFLLVAAEETPAPGLILVGLSSAVLIGYVIRSRRSGTSTTTTNSPWTAIDQDRQSYEEDVERRRRDEPDRWYSIATLPDA